MHFHETCLPGRAYFGKLGYKISDVIRKAVLSESLHPGQRKAGKSSKSGKKSLFRAFSNSDNGKPESLLRAERKILSGFLPLKIRVSRQDSGKPESLLRAERKRAFRAFHGKSLAGREVA